MTETVGDGDTVEGREVYEEEGQALERPERGEMGDVALKQGGVHQLLQRVGEPQYARVRSYPIRPRRDRFAPTLEPVLAREGDVPEEAASAAGDP